MNFAELISKALITGAGDERKKAEIDLITIRNENPPKFFEYCLKELLN